MARNFIDAWEIYDTHAYDYWKMLQSKDSERSAKYIHLGQKLEIITLYSKRKKTLKYGIKHVPHQSSVSSSVKDIPDKKVYSPRSKAQNSYPVFKEEKTL